MRGIFAALVAGVLSLGLVSTAHAQMPTRRTPADVYIGTDRDKYPVVYTRIPNIQVPIEQSSYMYPTVQFGGCHCGSCPAWEIPWTRMRSAYWGQDPAMWSQWGGWRGVY